jgi:Uncharacterized protein conserved in bacteria (DUF2059)
MSHSLSTNFVRAAALMLLAATFMSGGNIVPDSHANATASDAADNTAMASELAQMINNSDAVIGDGASDDRLRPIWLRMFVSNEDIAALEKQYPGTVNELLDATLPIINRSATVRLPVLQQRQAALYAQTFDSAELAFLLRFYGSPTGQKVLRLAVQNMQTANVEAAVKSSGDFSIGAKAVMADLQSTSEIIAQQVEGDDKAVLEDFGRSTAFLKLRQIGEQAQQIVLDWHNEYLPGEEEEIDAVMEAVFNRRMKTSN